MASTNPAKNEEAALHALHKAVAEARSAARDPRVVDDILVIASASPEEVRTRLATRDFSKTWPAWRDSLYANHRTDLVDTMSALGHRWASGDLHAALRAGTPELVSRLMEEPGTVVPGQWVPSTSAEPYQHQPAQTLLGTAIDTGRYATVEPLLQHRVPPSQDALDEALWLAIHVVLQRQVRHDPPRDRSADEARVLRLVRAGANPHRALGHPRDQQYPYRAQLGTWKNHELSEPWTAWYLLLSHDIETAIRRPGSQQPIDYSESWWSFIKEQSAGSTNPIVLIDVARELCHAPQVDARCGPFVNRLIKTIAPHALTRSPEHGVVAGYWLIRALLQPGLKNPLPWSLMRSSPEWNRSDIEGFMLGMVPLMTNPKVTLLAGRFRDPDFAQPSWIAPADQEYWKSCLTLLREAQADRATRSGSVATTQLRLRLASAGSEPASTASKPRL